MTCLHAVIYKLLDMVYVRFDWTRVRGAKHACQHELQGTTHSSSWALCRVLLRLFLAVNIRNCLFLRQSHAKCLFSIGICRAGLDLARQELPTTPVSLDLSSRSGVTSAGWPS